MSIPFMPLYVVDFDADTSHLTLAEDGAYNRLLRLCWRTPGCSIPNDHAWIARRMRVSQEEFEAVVLPVLEEFFSTEKGRVSNNRQRREFERAVLRLETATENGKKGGRPRKSLKSGGGDKTGGLDSGKPKRNPAETYLTTTTTTTDSKGSDEPDLPLEEGQKEAVKQKPIDLFPSFIDPAVAKGFLDNRKALKKPLTERAIQLLAKNLTEIRDAGHDPNKALDLATEKGWQTVKLEYLNGSPQKPTEMSYAQRFLAEQRK